MSSTVDNADAKPKPPIIPLSQSPSPNTQDTMHMHPSSASASASSSTTHHRPAFVHSTTFSLSPTPSPNPNSNTNPHSLSTHYPPLPRQSPPAPSTYPYAHPHPHSQFHPYRDHPPAPCSERDSEKVSLDDRYALQTLPNPYAHGQPPDPSSRRGSAFPPPLSSSTRPCQEGWLGKGLMLGWVVTTLMFLGATAFFRGELFAALDDLSKTLFSLGSTGKLIFASLILLTTIPPLPLYSTLIVLSGYTFGVWEGFIVSYIASLVGAVLVFVVSRFWLKDVISKCLQGSATATSLLSILPSNPHLLFLIRLAPYPYNLLNVILASAPTLTLRTYSACTALSLLKLVLHTWIGSGIHDLSESMGHHHGPPPPFSHPPPQHHHHHYHHNGGPPPWEGEGDWREWRESQHRERVKMYSTWAGIVLCVTLGVYLTHMAKRAIRRAQAEQEERDALPS